MTDETALAYVKQSPDDFDWPCHRREAHAEHWAEYPSGDHGGGTEERWCKGVKAHPRTMAGSFYRANR